SMNILEVKNLTQRFGELAAVDRLSFEVKDGEVFGIAGPNGSGKTTLFNSITGFYRYTGDVVFEGKSIAGLRPHQVCHRGIARTFQVPQLFLTMTVLKNLQVGAHFSKRHGVNEDDNIAEIVDFVGLHGKENIVTSHLNLYDQKLTMLANAMTTKPKLLMVDEPIGGLSPTETKDFLEIFKKINKELGITLVVIEHLMKFLTEISDRLMIIHDGSRIALGLPKEVTQEKNVIDVYLGGGVNA
ncbi:MAG: ABC transporter ATP-binding protein, partial [Dehalococcoidia bacterium]